jgi:hypothetical protein
LCGRGTWMFLLICRLLGDKRVSNEIAVYS